MAILNENDFYYLDSSAHGTTPVLEKRVSSFIWVIRDFTEDCYYFEFKHGDAFDVFPIQTLINVSDLDKIKSGKIRLVICNSHESFHYIVDGIYKSLIIRDGIPPNQITLLSESADILSEVKRISKQYQVEEIKVEWVRLFEADIQIQKMILLQQGHRSEGIAHKQYNKKFLNFNRRWRTHRPVLVALLHLNGLLPRGHVSLGVSDDKKNWDNIWNQIHYHHGDNDTIWNTLSKHKQEIQNLPPMHLDISDLTENQPLLDTNADYLYDETYFSVVTETNFYTRDVPHPARFLSEKTFKPIAHQHPFIMVSVPKMLEALRGIGYKSFSPWIDESYDNELDDSLRLQKIIDEIKRLSNLSPHEFTEFVDGIMDICSHNFKVLMNKKTFIDKLN